MKNKMKSYHMLLLCFVVFAKVCVGQIAAGKCKFLGNIIATTTPTDFRGYWNQVTPENAGKWGSVEATRNVMNWTSLDNAYNFALANNLPFKQHTFVWGQQQPSWMSALTAAEQKQEVEEWIKSYCERYPKTKFIDVVNEPLHAVPSYSEALGGAGLTGYDWIVWTFEKARQYCPDAKLILNDYNIINSDTSTEAYVRIINLLKNRNLIDGIGEQAHFLETTPLSTLKNNLDKLGATKLPIYISELDVDIPDDTQQKARYEELFPILWTHASVAGLTMWGYREGQMWRQNGYLVRSNNTERPALVWLKNYVANSDGGPLCEPVRIKVGDKIDFDIYPNPSRDGKIEIEVPQGIYEMDIMNSQGAIVYNRHDLVSGSYTIDVAIPPGFYLVKFSHRERTEIKKMLVQ